MKFPFLSAVVGTSFRSEVAAIAETGQRVVASREPDNPADPRAVRVELAGDLLGYLPRALAARLDGGPWDCEIVDVFGSDRLGIRVRVLGELADQPSRPTNRSTRTPASTPAAPSRRYVVNSPVNRSTTPPATTPEQGAEPGNVVLDDNEIVRARSGRILGVFVGTETGRVKVRTDDGREVSYPEALIIRERRIN